MLPLTKTTAMELGESLKYSTEITGIAKELFRSPPYPHKNVINKIKKKISFLKNFIDGDGKPSLLFLFELFSFDSKFRFSDDRDCVFICSFKSYVFERSVANIIVKRIPIIHKTPTKAFGKFKGPKGIVKILKWVH